MPGDDRRASDARARRSARSAIGALIVIVAGIACAIWMLHPPYYRKWDLVDLEVYRAAGKAVLHGHSVYGSYVARPVARAVAVHLSADRRRRSRRPCHVGRARRRRTSLWTVDHDRAPRVVVRDLLRTAHRPLGKAHAARVAARRAAMASLSPVEDHLRFGQVGIALMACCVSTAWSTGPAGRAACSSASRPRSSSCPGIFIPYLVAHPAAARRGRRGRDVRRAHARRGSSSRHPTRGISGPTRCSSPRARSSSRISRWKASSALARTVAVTLARRRDRGASCSGCWRAAVASLDGDELRGVAITGLVGVLVSPISWVHHLVWIIPALA